MILVAHILVALSSAVFTTYLLFVPSKTKFRISYALIAATLLSGTYLVISTHAALLQACMTGLAYLLALATLMAFAHRRFAVAEKLKNNQ